MADFNLQQLMELAPRLLHPPFQQMSVSFDAEADVLYLNFNKSLPVDDSELTPDDMIVRYHGEEIVGVTILHASSRFQDLALRS